MAKANRDRARPVVDKLVTPAVAGDEDHLNCGERFVRRLVFERRIKFVKIGKYVMIPESGITEFRDAGTVEAVR